MSTRVNYFKLGLFVIFAVALAIGAVLLLGIGSLLQKPTLMETYLDQSVQGIDLGTKVKFRGVPIGRVENIDFSRYRYELEIPIEERKTYVRIVIALENDVFDEPGTPRAILIKREIERGLRLQMSNVGLTGTSYLELDYQDPNLNPPLDINWTPEYAYIPSTSDSFTRIVTSAEEVFRKLEAVDLVSLGENVNNLLQVANEKLSDVELKEISIQIVELISELRNTNTQLQTAVKDINLPELSTEAKEAISSIRILFSNPSIGDSLDELKVTLRSINQLTAGNQGRISVILENLESLTDNLNSVTDSAKSYPSQLLFGEPPPSQR